MKSTLIVIAITLFISMTIRVFEWTFFNESANNKKNYKEAPLMVPVIIGMLMASVSMIHVLANMINK